MTSLPLRRFVTALLLLGVATTAVVVGLTRLEVRTDLATFLPPDDAVAQRYERYAQAFGADPVVVLLQSDEEQALLGADALQAIVGLEGQLSRLDGVTAVYGPGTLLNQVAGRAQDLLAELLGRRDATIAQARAEAKEDGRSVAAAEKAARSRFDARYGPLLVSGLPSGLPTLGNSRFVQRVVFDEDGQPRGQWRLVVPDRSSLAILVRPRAGLDAASTTAMVEDIRSAVREAGLDAAVSGAQDEASPAPEPGSEVDAKVAGASVIVSALSDRAVRDVPVLGALAVVAIGLCFAAATWIGRRRRLLPLATTVVAIVVTLAVLGLLGRPLTVAGIAFLSVLLGLGCYYPTYLAMRASTRTFVTVVAASACSLGTLALSPLPLVRDLGLVLAVGVVLAGVAAWGARPWLVDAADPTGGPPAVQRPPRFGRRRRLVGGVVLAALGASAVFGWWQLSSLTISTDVDDFAAGLPEIDEARDVESALGSSGEIALVVGSSDVVTPAGLSWMRGALDGIVEQHGDVLRPIVSLPALMDFLGDDPAQEEVDAAYGLLPRYMTSSVVSADRSTGVLTFGVSIDDLAEVGAVVDEATASLPPVPEGFETRMTGLPLVLLRAEELVGADRYHANVIGIGVAGLVLLVGLRRRVDALRGVAAASIATGTSFAVAAVGQGQLDPITAALGALTAAVGCEFTVMLCEAERGHRLLGRGVLLVAATSVVGYLVLLASGLQAVRDFGWFLALGVTLAFISSWAVVTATTRTVGDATADGDTAPAAPGVAGERPVGVGA